MATARRLGATLVLLLALHAPALAHHSAEAESTEGLAIPSLTHGQMAVIAVHRAAILDLAARQEPTDPTMRRLDAFARLQFFACLWGVMPGSISDEASPFNECAHAYLAATRALLAHLREMDGEASPAAGLSRRIEREMAADARSTAMCDYSDEPFNTAAIVAPRWSDIPGHAPTAAALGGSLLALLACALAARRGLASRRDHNLATGP